MVGGRRGEESGCGKMLAESIVQVTTQTTAFLFTRRDDFLARELQFTI